MEVYYIGLLKLLETGYIGAETACVEAEQIAPAEAVGGIDQSPFRHKLHAAPEVGGERYYLGIVIGAVTHQHTRVHTVATQCLT